MQRNELRPAGELASPGFSQTSLHQEALSVLRKHHAGQVDRHSVMLELSAQIAAPLPESSCITALEWLSELALGGVSRSAAITETGDPSPDATATTVAASSSRKAAEVTHTESPAKAGFNGQSPAAESPTAAAPNEAPAVHSELAISEATMVSVLSRSGSIQPEDAVDSIAPQDLPASDGAGETGEVSELGLPLPAVRALLSAAEGSARKVRVAAARMILALVSCDALGLSGGLCATLVAMAAERVCDLELQARELWASILPALALRQPATREVRLVTPNTMAGPPTARVSCVCGNLT